MEKEKLNYKDYFYGEPLQHTVSNHIFYYQEAKTPKQRASFYRMARLNCLRDDQEQRICSALSCLQHLKAQFHFPSNWIQCAIQSTRKVIQIQKKQEDIHFIAVCALFIEARRNKFEITSAEILGASKVHANLNRMHKVLAQFAFVWGPVKHWVPTGKLKEKLEEVAKEYLPNLTPAEIHQTYKKCLELRKRAGRLRGSPISVIAALIYLQWQKYNLTQKQVAKKLGTSDMTIRGIKRQIEARLGEKFSLG
jgi:transcription initiation factor TFIIIB Brf1 subunit/transcription initiation factor TFIIB